MKVLQLLLIFSFLLNIPFASFPELEGSASADQLSHTEKTAPALIVLEKFTTTNIKRVVTKTLAPLPDQTTLFPEALIEINAPSPHVLGNTSLVQNSIKARAPPV